MNRIIFIIGSCLIVIGVFVCVLCFPVFYSTETLMDETFVVPAGTYHSQQFAFYVSKTLGMRFSVAEGSTVDFWIVSDFDYQYFLTHGSIIGDYWHYNVSALDVDWNPPIDSSSKRGLWFVWDNSDSATSKTVDALLAYGGYTHLPFWALTLGMFIVFSGFGTVAFGYKPPAISKGTIIAGYVFASLGGLIGIGIGSYLGRKESNDEKLHGKNIIIIDRSIASQMLAPRR